MLVYDIELTEFINRKVSILKLQSKDPLLTSSEMKDLFEQIRASNIMDKEIREIHIALLKGKLKKTDSKASIATCEVCGREVSEKVQNFCLNQSKFKGKIYCFNHQKK